MESIRRAASTSLPIILIWRGVSPRERNGISTVGHRAMRLERSAGGLSRAPLGAAAPMGNCLGGVTGLEWRLDGRLDCAEVEADPRARARARKHGMDRMVLNSRSLDLDSVKMLEPD